MPDVKVTPQSWLWRPRIPPVRLIEIHATRGSTTPEQQKSAALNWVQSPDNRYVTAWSEVWGSSFSYVIGADGSMGTVLDDDQTPTYSAGYGGPGSTYAIDEYGISYELAQSAAMEPFTDACYLRAAKEVAGKCKKHGIPAVFVEISVQTGEVPTGLVRHDRCQNGYVLGKTDPGEQFDENKFLALVRAEMEDAMAWSNWEDMSGQAIGGPAVASWAAGRLDLFVVGAKGTLYHKWYQRGHGWRGWESLGAPAGVQLVGTPAAVSWVKNRLDVFVVGQNRRTYHLYWQK